MKQLLSDVQTIIWKEWTEFVRQRATIVSMLFFVAIFGVFLPYQRGRPWVESSGVLLNSAFIPVMLVLGVVTDSFAGERERHTLETLLATRLTDRAILLGKFAAVVGYGWGLTVSSLLAALVTVNVTAGSGELLLYPARIGAGGVVFSLLTAGLCAGVGVLVSLRAATVRQAAQTLTVGMMALFFIGITLLTRLPRAWREAIADAVKDAGPDKVMVVLAAALLALDVALVTVAVVRFRRARLIVG